MKITICPIANKEHKASKRQYAHSYHKPGVICVAKAFMDLPGGYKAGILAHEYGHVVADLRSLGKWDEDLADFLAKKLLKIKMTRIDSPNGKNLQWTSPKNLAYIMNEIGKL